MPTRSAPDHPPPRREIEARIVGPLIRGFMDAMGRDAALEVVRGVITELAREGGADLAARLGDASLSTFAQALDLWREGGALEIDLLEQTPERLSFNVTRCRYAEMYRALGLADLGGSLSCQRDFALVEGFNPGIRLERTQTSWKGPPTVTSVSGATPKVAEPSPPSSPGFIDGWPGQDAGAPAPPPGHEDFAPATRAMGPSRTERPRRRRARGAATSRSARPISDRVQVLQLGPRLGAALGGLDEREGLHLAVDLEGELARADDRGGDPDVAGRAVREPDVDALQVRLERPAARCRCTWCRRRRGTSPCRAS